MIHSMYPLQWNVFYLNMKIESSKAQQFKLMLDKIIFKVEFLHRNYLSDNKTKTLIHILVKINGQLPRQRNNMYNNAVATLRISGK